MNSLYINIVACIIGLIGLYYGIRYGEKYNK